MNTKELVMLSADANFVPVKYFVMEVSVGSSLAASYAWLKIVGYGIDTEDHFDDYVESIRNSSFDGGKPVDLVGTMGEYSIAALSTLSAYKSKKSNADGPYQIG